MKSRIIFFLVLILSVYAHHSMAQELTAQNQDKKVYSFVEQMPEYEGGQTALIQFIANEILGADIKLKGKIVLSFVVDDDGTINDVHILEGINEKANEACKKAVLATTGKWTIGKQNGEAVAVRFVLPIKFKR